jgi:hypothetical protein
MKTFMAFACFMAVSTAAVAAEPAVPSGADHLNLALHYQEKAAENDAQGAAYEQAAKTYRNSPMIKNLISPTTPGRFEYIAKTYREKAAADRKRAASHENKAKLSTGL